MSQPPPPVMSWGIVILVVVIGGLFFWGLAISNMRTAECEARGGTLFQSRAGTTCIKDGSIIIIWQNGQKIENP